MQLATARNLVLVGRALLADRGPGKRPLWVWVATALVTLTAAVTVALILFLGVLSRGLPSTEWARDYRPDIVSEVWSGDQQLIGEFSSRQFRRCCRQGTHA